MTYISYEKYGPEYQKLWDTMKVIRDAPELSKLASKFKEYESVYRDVQKDTGVPAELIFVIHVREAGEGDVGKWKGVLHNGQKIVGTGRKTTIVPTGRGPFRTWKEAAVDALTIQGFTKIKDWPVARMLWALEPYNGYGYRQHGVRSPYLWASTNHQQSGKFVADHDFRSDVWDTQIGCAAMLKFLGAGKGTATPPIGGGGVIVGGGIAAAMYPHMWVWILGGTLVGALAVWFLAHWLKRKTNVN